MTILSQSKPSSHLQAGLGKAVSWMFEVFSEHITVWGFSEPGDDSPFLFFFWMELGEEEVRGLAPLSHCSFGAEARVWKVGQGPM